MSEITSFIPAEDAELMDNFEQLSSRCSNEWDEVMDFWFPETRLPSVNKQRHADYWYWRMRGGADEEIISRFSDLTERAANGDLHHWALDAHGRLALIIILDQFSRSVWRNHSRAYAQDDQAKSLTIEGLSNGHYQALETPWFKIVFSLPLGHCEGPDHLQRIDLLISLREEIASSVPEALQSIYFSLIKQAHDVREIIANFNRHPHRNKLLLRNSTPEEEAYITQGNFPHLRAFQQQKSL